MDYLANIAHVGLNLSKNPIVVNVDPASPVTYPSRVGLRYFLELWIPEFSGAQTFQKLTTLEASEIPPATAAGATSYPGAYFELQEILNSLLESCVPDFGLAKIALCNTLTSPYYTKAIRKNGNVTIDTTTLPSGYVYRGGINPKHYADYKDSFFTSFVGAKRKFLTWKLNYSPVREDQPEYLHFLTNFSPLPTDLRLRVEIHYSDSTSETITALSTSDVLGMGVYVMPVGPKALGLLARPKKVNRYVVWLSNQANERISEERTYWIDRTPIKQVRYILFQNSVGVYDTLVCTGDGIESLKVERQRGERFTGYDYLPTSAETVINKVTGERQLSINFGFPKFSVNRWREYWQEVIFSEQSYLVTDRAHIPLQPLTDSYVTADDNEETIGRSMVYKYANEEHSYSVLPAVVSVSRPTAWRGEALSCELDASTGLRNGKKRYQLLVKYYSDNGQDVKPLTQKSNAPGTEGYISPWASVDCAATTTPYRSAAISRLSSYRRSGCLDGKVGTKWTIGIPAYAYGSEINQGDADAKAVAAQNAQDTQANADVYGACVNPDPISVKLNVTHGVAIVAVYRTYPTDEFIPNTSPGSPQARTIVPGTYNFIARNQEATANNFRFRIPSRGLTSQTFSGPVNWSFQLVIEPGEAEIVIYVENP